LRDRLRRHNEKVLTCWIDFRRLRVAYRTFELADPRDTDLVPRLVGYCRAKQRPVWKSLWALKCFSDAKWAVWFRDMEAAGVEPVEKSGWAIGIAMPIHLRLAQLLVTARVKQLYEMGSDPGNPSPWLCNVLRTRGKGRRRIGRLLPDGTVERFESLCKAARAAGIAVAWVSFLASTASTDAKGCTWFDA